LGPIIGLEKHQAMNHAILSAVAMGCLFSISSAAQRIRTSDVPDAVKTALQQAYPTVSGVYWEREKGNYEANWGGASHEDHSVLYTPAGVFVEQVEALPVAQLPPGVLDYVHSHYPGAKITEAGKVIDSRGLTRYEAEVKGKDLLFDDKGSFLKFD
jgi:hypothetical protein